VMLRFAPLLLLLIAFPTFGMDMATVEAVINSCQKEKICSCPRAKISRIDKSACGSEPKWVQDNGLQIDGQHNAEKYEKYNKCLSDLFNANSKIDSYNAIFDRCQNPGSTDGKTKFTNLPARPVYSGEGKTLNEQVQDVKAAERAQEQGLREEEAAGQAEESRAGAADQPPMQPARQPAEELDACLAAVHADPSVISLRIGSNMNVNCRAGSSYAQWSACTQIIVPACIAAINSGAFRSQR
jgi:hypothetical protein